MNYIHSEKKLNFDEIHPFEFSLNYTESYQTSDYPHHMHDECEIYINLDGDVSFMVENHIYPIKKGSIIIARPWEYHHCIYHSKAVHKHFWILFSSNGNEKYLESFFSRPSGTGNLIELPEKETEELINICFSLIEKNLSPIEQYILFFKLISLLGTGNIRNISANLPDDIIRATEFVDSNINKPITVKEVSEYAHISINSLERHFKEHLQMTPAKYIKRKKLIYSTTLLSKQLSINEVCEKSGFTDYSGFISSFKKEFGITPHKYKVKHLKHN